MKCIEMVVRCFSKLSITTNGISNLPFVLSLSKDLISVSLAITAGSRTVAAAAETAP